MQPSRQRLAADSARHARGFNPRFPISLFRGGNLRAIEDRRILSCTRQLEPHHIGNFSPFADGTVLRVCKMNPGVCYDQSLYDNAMSGSQTAVAL